MTTPAGRVPSSRSARGAPGGWVPGSQRPCPTHGRAGAVREPEGGTRVDGRRPHPPPGPEPPRRPEAQANARDGVHGRQGSECVFGRPLHGAHPVVAGWCSTSARPRTSMTGGTYIPKRPRRPFLRPYQRPTGLSGERPHASMVPSTAGFCSSALPFPTCTTSAGRASRRGTPGTRPARSASSASRAARACHQWSSADGNRKATVEERLPIESRDRENVAVGIPEPGDAGAGRGAPDPERVLVHAREAIERDAATGELAHGRHEVIDPPAEDGERLRLELVHSRHAEHDAGQVEHESEALVRHEGEPERVLVERTGSSGVGGGDERDGGSSVEHRPMVGAGLATDP